MTIYDMVDILEKELQRRKKIELEKPEAYMCDQVVFEHMRNYGFYEAIETIKTVLKAEGKGEDFDF